MCSNVKNASEKNGNFIIEKNVVSFFFLGERGWAFFFRGYICQNPCIFQYTYIYVRERTCRNIFDLWIFFMDFSREIEGKKWIWKIYIFYCYCCENIENMLFSRQYLHPIYSTYIHTHSRTPFIFTDNLYVVPYGALWELRNNSIWMFVDLWF